ncbi:Rv3654c family TadE-like protein [Saccharomonospora cyanea]|uniref:Helicase/secretion neighborhood TadE-like protein n=1 Tax=Saccharomonospora cyanea NA-134 TaxID=882082 RepID=H5XK90_9PSEU|nr:Rv3654c family TadE-like protein [Saccharomonospora cyanea]EHR63525.1 helicase/secretion neighborhood TadE-like protein [Saccharomonospora cyanea NA-134]
MLRRDDHAVRCGGQATCRESDTGVAAVWAACVVAALLALAGLLWTLGGVLVVRQRVAGAADLAALAAAGHAVMGEERACAHAEEVAHAMAAWVSGCRLRGWDALVVVHSEMRGPIGLGGTVTARARAGPVGETWEFQEPSGGR